MKSLRVYLARGMSGRIKAKVVKEAKHDRSILIKAGITPLCPVLAENIKSSRKKLVASKEKMDSYWFRDKEMIREANVVFDMTPELKSEGVAHEIGYARYFLYKPVVRVYEYGKMPSVSSVAFYEDDVVVDSIYEAILYADFYWGTWSKRVSWRIGLYKRCFLGMIRAFIGGWK